MTYTMHYDSPLGGILLAADEEGLTGLWFETQKYFAAKLAPEHEERVTPALDAACRWLDVYFSGREPDFTPKLHLVGSDFRQAVWALLRKIPYGQTTTYGALAGQLAEQSGKRVSAQAVGGAVGHNPVSLIVPCHRVVGSGGSLTGYAGGVEKKMRLLTLTPADFDLDKGLLSITKSYQRLKGRDVITDPETPKSVRVIQMPQFLTDEIRDYLKSLYKVQPDQRIFEVTKSYLHHEMDRGAKAAGVKRIRIHDLRHSHVSLLIEMGFSALAIADRVGHESVDITYKYAHLFPSKQQEMAQKLDMERKEG